MVNQNIVFFMRHFTGRGVERSIYDYALHNESILKNKSYIVSFSRNAQRNLNSEIHFPTKVVDYEMFSEKFTMLEIEIMEDMKDIIEKYNIHFFYTQVHGQPEPIYQFENKTIWGKCKTIKHTVFNTEYPESDFHISSSQFVNLAFQKNIPVIPLMISFSEKEREIKSNLRERLGIPSDALVFGRYGAYDQFDIPFVHYSIKGIVEREDMKHVYFLFMNTEPLFVKGGFPPYFHPNIFYLEFSSKNQDKIEFINTCDAMLHARQSGETFGMSVAEFSIMNKPILTSPYGDNEHLLILKNKALIYVNDKHLKYMIEHFKEYTSSNDDWNAYNDYVPEKVMNLFDKLVFSKYDN